MKNHNSIEHTLMERAKELARRPAAESTGETMDLVEFLLGTDTYAFELKYVLEATTLSDVAHIPRAPVFVLGVVQLRGIILPVIDLTAFIKVAQAPLRVFNKALILRAGTQSIAVRADEIIGVTSVPVSDIQKLARINKDDAGEYILGVTTRRSTVLDASKIISDPRVKGTV